MKEKIVTMYTQMALAHQDFIQSMLGIAYTTKNEEMQELISSHMDRMRDIMNDDVNPTQVFKQSYRNRGLDATDFKQGDDFNIIGTGGMLS